MEIREIAKLALQGPIPIGQNLPADSVRRAIEGFELPQSLKAQIASENGSEGKIMGKARDALRPIGAKLAPAMSQNQADAWLDALVMSLQGYPLATIVQIGRRAVQEPFPYGINSVDAKLHEIAKEIEGRQKKAVLWLRLYLRDLERTQRQKLIAAPEDKPLTIEEIAALPPHLYSMGVTGGFISEEEQAAVKALREQHYNDDGGTILPRATQDWISENEQD